MIYNIYVIPNLEIFCTTSSYLYYYVLGFKF